jgi:hypothetical protein
MNECTSELTFKFESKEAVQHLKTWLSHRGEQDYWMWMECREDEESGPITGIDFDYSKGSVVPVQCGRIKDGY